MNYELAKQLHEAGFPNMTFGYFDPNSNTVSTGKVDGWQMRWFMPNLSELIDAIPYENFALYGEIYEGKQHDWIAEADMTTRGYGTTKEEACALLYLALKGT